MSDKRQKNQLVLAFTEEGRSEAPKASQEGTESLTAKCETERPARHEQLMEEVCERENCWQAYKRVKANKGSPGIDGMKVGDLSGYLKQHWPSIREQLLSGTYQPQPVRRVEIPKPDGGVRKLGIPTVLDRLIQQAVMQVLQRRWDPTFSEHSHGFRPKRSAHQAVAKAQQYIAAGHRWVVDLDLEKFFDRVNHDKLMHAIARRVTDKRVLRLIGAFLKVGVLENGLVSPAEEGTPQGGPLSPLLSNIVLDELDRELERRKHRFVRYADDCNIYVRSQRAGQRVMTNVTRFLTRPAQAQGKRDQECGGSTSRAEVLGVPLQQQQGTEAAHRAEGPVALQAENPGTDATDARNQSGTNAEGTDGLLKGLEGLLRLLSDTLAATATGSMDTPSVAIHDLEAMETRETTVRETTPTRGCQGARCTNSGKSARPLACGEQPGLVHRASARLLRLSRASSAVRWPCVTL